MPMKSMHSHWHPSHDCCESTSDPGLGHVGVHDVGLQSSQGAGELHERSQLAPQANRALQLAEGDDLTAHWVISQVVAL